jgi:RecA-family ATPase
LWQLAEGRGLVIEVGPDQVQAVMAREFDGRANGYEPPPGWGEPLKAKREQRSDEPPALSFVDIARDPIPPRAWAVHERIPARNVTLLSGEGAIGKSLLLLQLSAATVLGRDWIGTLPEPGPVIYLSCEEDDDEVRRRLQDIATHCRVSRDDLKENLHIVSLAGKDAVLGRPDRSDRILVTPLFEQIKRQALRGLAIESDSAVILSSHPSLTGISTDTGLSGNTAWRTRSRS